MVPFRIFQITAQISRVWRNVARKGVDNSDKGCWKNASFSVRLSAIPIFVNDFSDLDHLTLDQIHFFLLMRKNILFQQNRLKRNKKNIMYLPIKPALNEPLVQISPPSPETQKYLFNKSAKKCNFRGNKEGCQNKEDFDDIKVKPAPCYEICLIEIF